MKLNKFIYLLFAGALLNSACKKSFLDEQPSTDVQVQTSINTTNDLADAVNGMYNAIKTTTLFGRDVPVLGDLLADNTYVNVTNSGRYLTTNNYQFISSTAEPANIYSQSYYGILQANRIIYESKKLPASTNNSQLMGEAYATRGLLYLNLVNWFGAAFTVNPNAPGVPLMTAPSYVTGFDLRLPRASVTAVYNQIISDLDSAYTLMPPTSTTFHAITSNYIAKYAVKAIEARAYLYKGDYANALAAAKLVVDNGGYSLAPNASAFTTYWSTPTSQTAKLESIFELNQNASSNLGNTGLDAMYSQAGYGDIQATDDLYNSYSATDVRRTLLVNGLRGGQPAWIINKFPNYSNTDKDETKIIRYAEIILTLAEAYARTSDDGSARTYLNQLAKLRDPSLAGYTSSGAQLITDILNERRKELAFEGLRFFDLKRLNLTINRPVQQYSYVSYPTVSTTDFRRILPIPLSAIDANPSLTQNPGY